MSRSLGLREDQRLGAELATRITGLFPQKPVWSLREQARSHIRSASEFNGVNDTGPVWERRCGDPTCSRRRRISHR